MYLLNQSHADGRSRHPSAVSFSPAGGTYTHPSSYVDTRFRDDRKPLSIVLSPESTTPEAYGPLSLSDIGDTTKVSWHTASGWTANMSANMQFGNELAGWPDRVRMFAGDQAYTTNTARVFTASGKMFTVSPFPNPNPHPGEYSIIEAGPSDYASRKIRYCIETAPPQSSHAEGCFRGGSGAWAVLVSPSWQRRMQERERLQILTRRPLCNSQKGSQRCRPACKCKG